MYRTLSHAINEELYTAFKKHPSPKKLRHELFEFKARIHHKGTSIRSKFHSISNLLGIQFETHKELETQT